MDHIDQTGKVVNELMGKYMALSRRVKDLDTPHARRLKLSVRIGSGKV